MALKFRIGWIILLLLFFYTQKRYDIDEHWIMRYNNIETIDLIVG